MTAEQLQGLLLDMYDFRLSPREYFSFFLAPDADSLLQKYQKAIDKELSRGSFRKIKARIMVINRLIRDFDSYKTGSNYNLMLKMHTLRGIMHTERRHKIPATLEKGACSLLKSVLKESDHSQCADTILPQVNKLLLAPEYGTPHLKQLLIQALPHQ